MVSSQNGFSANDRSQVETYLIGGKTKVALRKGAPGWLLQHLGNWFDANIRDIDPGILDDWGYAERPIRGGTELSNHASGTALDVDATKWPLGVEPTKYLTKDEIAKLKDHLTLYEGAIRWGGDYTGRKDPMHFEINRDEAFCARIQAKLLAAPGYTPPSEEDPFMALSQQQQETLTQDAALARYAIVALVKPVTDTLLTIIQDEDAQTDLLMWAVTDPAEGLRNQVARVQATLDAGAAVVGGASVGELAGIVEQSLAKTNAPLVEKLAGLADSNRAKAEAVSKLAAAVSEASDKLGTAAGDPPV
ncbi:M15 family metallopeptidase [Blastococcus sp. CT_GayMR16]|uniref:M15 family metallopeptidase n=1 Tax=Blastococcus sp. CT_GayMR16 TaxID=2559607 RepID=UPI001072F7BA|nr:M15 family metallopeptidase [Blastococcus sp. CT_GayMR16]TFV83169.1 M15 family peptidase [Blastococcus sp. CT_GayMR16]